VLIMAPPSYFYRSKDVLSMESIGRLLKLLSSKLPCFILFFWSYNRQFFLVDHDFPPRFPSLALGKSKLLHVLSGVTTRKCLGSNS